MPIDIEDVTTTVHVEPSGAGGEGGGQPTADSGPEAQQRWLALAARSHQLAERTSAWRFDD